jgi:hypothetical protein
MLSQQAAYPRGAMKEIGTTNEDMEVGVCLLYLCELSVARETVCTGAPSVGAFGI